MNALLLDYTHPLLEQGLEQGGISLWREYELSPEEFPSHYFTAEILVIRSRFPMTREIIDLFPNVKAIISLHVLMTRIAISPLLAINTFLNIMIFLWLYDKKRLIEFNRFSIVN